MEPQPQCYLISSILTHPAVPAVPIEVGTGGDIETVAGIIDPVFAGHATPCHFYHRHDCSPHLNS